MSSLEAASRGDVIEELAALADDCGAHALVGDVPRLDARQLCRRLRQHLHEHDRALARANAAPAARVNALSIARVLVEKAIAQRAHAPDAGRIELGAWLAVERTKFLMATKADAFVAFDDRLGRAAPPRHLLRQEASAIAAQIASELLASLRARLTAAVEARGASYAATLVAELDGSLGDLGEAMPLDAVAALQPAPAFAYRRDLDGDGPHGALAAYLLDRLRLAGRRRVERLAREHLTARLELGSQQLVTHLLDDYDDAREWLHRKLCELMDRALDSAQLATAFADHARADGADGLARARGHVARWQRRLAEIDARLA